MAEVRMPKLGESVTEGTVSRWLKAPGETVALREPLLEISTDKIDTEIPSPAAGTVLALLIAEGETVAVGTLLAEIGETGGVKQAARETVAEPSETAPVASTAKAAHPQAAEYATGRNSPTSNGEIQAQERPVRGRAYLSPVVQRMVAEYHIDLAQIVGTGLGGRITKKDLLAYLDEAGAADRDEAPPAPVDAQVTPLSTMRRTIARHMVESVRTAPHVATVFEVDMSAVVRHREAERAAYQARGIRLTYTAYFVHAVAQALRRHARVNDRFTDEGVVHNAHVHIGIAVSLGEDGREGLIVPVLRNADELTLSGIARALGQLSDAARSGSLQPDDLQEGTFSITNHGVGGSLIGTPIIVQPQSAILGIGAIVKRAVVKSSSASLLPNADDAILVRPMCYLTLSFDHRILDGATADAFLRDVQYQLEAWSSPEEANGARP